MIEERTLEHRRELRRRLEETLESVEHAMESYQRVRNTVSELKDVVNGCTIKRCVTTEEAHLMETMINELNATLLMTA